jgi:hypothetical protein
MWTAARLLGDADETAVRHFAYGVGVANIFQATPALITQNRKPMIDGSASGLTALASKALGRLDQAEASRQAVSKEAGSALVAGYHARPVLKMAQANPDRVTQDTLDTNPARESLRFLNISLRGWWR